MKHFGTLRRPDRGAAGGFFPGSRKLDRDELQFRRRRVPLTVFAVLAVSAALGCQDAAKPTSPDVSLSGATASLGLDKVALCHAASRGNDARFVELTVSGAALSAHLNENGRARPGHEDDYLVTARTPCPPPPLTAPNVRICKAVNADILLSRFFDFEVNGEEVSIRGSTCVDRTFRVGTPVTVTETVAAGTELYSITITPAAAGTGNVTSATATVIAGIDFAEVSFRNHALLGQLMICKRVEQAGLVGKQFEFVVAPPGAPAQTFISGPATMMIPGTCTAAGTYPVGTVANVIEVPSLSSVDVGIIASAITVVPADRLVPGSVNLETRRASVTIGEGLTQVRFVNARPVGTLEICTVTPAGFTGAPEFLVNAAWADGGLARLNVPANQCVTVQPLGFGFPVGFDVTIGEVIPAGLRLDAVTVDPPDHLIGTTTNTANVLIGAGTTRVTFRHVFVTP